MRYFLNKTLFLLIAGFAILSLTGCGGSSSSSNGGGDPSIKIATAPAQIGAGANWQFTATVTGSPSSAVNWAVTTQNGGTIDPSSGLYIAPLTGTFPMNVSISATAQSDASVSASTSIGVTQTDPLGSAQGTMISCPTFGGGLTGSTCYQINTSCDGVADFSVYLKVNAPAGNPLGTVIFATGTGGAQLYDFDEPDFFNGTTNGGDAVVQGVLDAGFTTVQVTFGSPFTDSTPNGWLTGPGGVRRLACRYATVAQWVYQNIHNSSTTAPMCATGNSGGSAAIGYALSDYGLDSIFSMVEATSGPPMSRLDQACLPPSNATCAQQSFTCNAGDQPVGLSLCYGNDDAAIVDTAYPQPYCENAINGAPAPAGFFLSDSVLGAPPRTFPKTRVNQLFGGQDLSAAVLQGISWGNAVGSTHSCISDAPHPIPSAQDGAAAILADITNLCRLQ